LFVHWKRGTVVRALT